VEVSNRGQKRHCYDKTYPKFQALSLGETDVLSF